MAEQVIDTVVTKFVADVRDYMSGAKEVTTSLKVLGGLAGTVAVGISTVLGTAFSRLNDMAEEATEFNRFAKSIGMSIEKLQQWEYAVSQTGGSLKSLQGSLTGLTTKLDAIPLQGNSPVLVMLNRLGINAYSAGGGIKKASDILLELSSRMKGMSNSQALTVGKMLGIDTATIQLLQKGRHEVDLLLRRGKETSVYTKEYAERLERLKVAQENNSRQWKKAGDILALLFLPLLEKLVRFQEKVGKAVAKTAEWIRDHIALFKLLGATILTFMGILALMNAPAFIAGILALGEALLSIALPVAGFLLLTAVLMGVVGLLQDIYVWATGGESKFGELYEKIAVFAFIAKELLLAPFVALWLIAIKVFNEIMKLWDKVTDYFKSHSFGQIILDAIMGIIGMIPVIGGKLKKALNNAFGGGDAESSDSESSDSESSDSDAVNSGASKGIIGKDVNVADIMKFTAPIAKNGAVTPLSNSTTNNQTTTTNMGGVNITVLSNDPLTAGRDVQQTLVDNANFGGQP